MEKAVNKDFKSTIRAILSYCLRVFVFLVLRRLFTSDIYAYYIYAPFICLLTKNMDPDYGFGVAGLYAILGIFIECYINAKITGVFKKLDGLNFFVALFIVFLVDILFNYFVMVQVQFMPFKIGFVKDSMMFFAPWAFLMYRVLGFLTKIFPVPFEKIGYIFSIEFVKDVIKKIWMNYGNN